MKALLFINGIPPEKIPDISAYELIACTDGAFNYLKEMNFSAEKLDFISGDFDSHCGKDETLPQVQSDIKLNFIYTPDQDKTDFEKALEILAERGATKVDVYGGSGGEMDHFLGNLTVAFKFKETLEIAFFDANSTYFFCSENIKVHVAKGSMVSLYPFPTVEKIFTSGLEWPLQGEDLSLQNLIGTRNRASEEIVDIKFLKGDLIIFLHH